MALATGYANAASRNMVKAYVAQYGGSPSGVPDHRHQARLDQLTLPLDQVTARVAAFQAC